MIQAYKDGVSDGIVQQSGIPHFSRPMILKVIMGGAVKCNEINEALKGAASDAEDL